MIAKPLGISVHDHIIVGKEGPASQEGAEAYLARFSHPSDSAAWIT